MFKMSAISTTYLQCCAKLLTGASQSNEPSKVAGSIFSSFICISSQNTIYYTAKELFTFAKLSQKDSVFYRAMRHSAKLGLAIACRPSVRLSVTLVDQDHIGWKCWKLIAQSISPTPSLFVAQRPST